MNDFTEQQYADLGRELVAVLDKPEWSTAERIAVCTTIVTHARHGERKDDVRVLDMSYEDLARLAGKGCGEDTLRDTFNRLRCAGFERRKPGKVLLDKSGRPLDRAYSSKADELQARWETVPEPLVMPARIDYLPDVLTDSPLKTKTQRKNKAKQAQWLELKAQAAGKPCPSCGHVGEIHLHLSASCGKCGKTFTEAETVDLLDAEPGSQLTREQIDQTDEILASVLRGVRQARSDGLLSDQTDEILASALADIPKPKVLTLCQTESFGYGDLDEKEAQNDEIGSAESFGCLPEQGQPKVSAALIGAESIGREAEDWALSVLADGIPTLTGIASVEHLALMGGMFALADSRKHGINPLDDMGAPLSYLDCPFTADSQAVKSHLAAGGNVSLLPEHSSLAVVDVDIAGPEFLRAHPALAMADRVIRRNAPERVKVVVMCPDPGASCTFESADKSRKIELIGKGKHAIVAGTHETGAVIELAPGYEVVVMTWAELVALAQDWAGCEPPAPSLSAQPLASHGSMPTVAPAGSVPDAIRQWIDEHGDEVMDTLGNPSEGAYISLRPDDNTPSARCTVHDGRVVLRDYGSGESLDAFDIRIRQLGIDKRVAIGRLMNGRRVEDGVRCAAR